MRLTMLIAAAVLALPATAAAAPPPNDNYLASSTINRPDGTIPLEFNDAVDTTEATTQPDTFNPNRDGLPFGGGDPEPTSCGSGPSYGKTVWWDFRPPTAGGVQIKANAGFDVVVAVYTWSSNTSRITRRVLCRNDQLGSEDVIIPTVRRGTNYTVQVGGASNTGGPLGFQMFWFPDRDGDGVSDELDDCPRVAGVGNSGCPPELRSAPRISYSRSGTSLRVTSLEIDDVPKGGRAEVSCRRCGRKVVRRAARRGTLKMAGFVGRVVPAGDRIEVRITLGKTGKGRYRHGAVGKYYRWPIEPGKLGRRVTRCLAPGSRKPTKCG